LGTQEWILLALVLVIPLIVAVVVTLWTLEQAIKRNKKNQPNRKVRRVAEPVADSDTSVGAAAPVPDVGEELNISTSPTAGRSVPPQEPLKPPSEISPPSGP
jgi:hypothetical protein